MSESLRPSPTVLIDNLPAKTLVGVDLLAFTSAPNFHGIKELSPGAHILYTGTTDSFSLRTGEWFVVSGPNEDEQSSSGIDVRLRHWDKSTELLALVDESKDEGRQRAMQQRANLSRIWAAGGLLSYKSRTNKKNIQEGTTDTTVAYDEWNSLSSYITPSVLERMLGPAELDSEGRPRWVISSGSSAARDSDKIPGLTSQEDAKMCGRLVEEEKELRFLPVDLKNTWPPGAVGRERTEAARDRSWALGNICEWATNNSRATGRIITEDNLSEGELQILGEMQVTFLTALTLINFSCQEQWMRLLQLVFTCQKAIEERQCFFIEVLRLLKLQLAHNDDVEGGLLEMDGDDGNTMVKKVLMKFRRIIYEDLTADVLAVKAEFIILEKWVNEEYGWELAKESTVRRGMVELEDGEQVELEVKGAEEEDETGDYAPVIVNLEESGEVEAEDVEDIEDIDMLDQRM
ncbi:AAR2 domain-containing protein [Nannizzia gypsea CBS 118893]|uniref:AAR2 domain-containing protein n=1 Tax=Arthroderma gypseum (strain ATCC MYA-4604 / CBS 118893) TaxID=535722 RepID=E5R1N4_ARTGP|nr:AAR2 domain-containing protein [Nannizzia gypsea CBS 118893]EFQ97732.1 AAR2 domain-containing protein [Nannizzia gypsea CBS 118893]